jgi:hypothetical protein
MNRTNNKITLAILMISMIPLACTMFVGGPEYPATTIPISTEEVGNFDQQLEIAKTVAADTGVLTLTLNQTQVTSFLAATLASQPDPIIEDPQVFLQNGEILVYGRITQANIKANVRILLAVTVDEQGQPVISVSSAEFGPLPAPQGLNDSITALIDQAFTGALGPAATGLRLESIMISDGLMTITGRVK